MRRQTLIVVTLLAAAACARQPEKPATAARITMTGPLIAATVSMKAAWEFPRNPLDDKTLDTSRLSEEIRRGFRLFTNTPAEAPRLAPGGMACTNCHMNARQRERSMPLVDVAGAFPPSHPPPRPPVRPRRPAHPSLPPRAHPTPVLG